MDENDRPKKLPKLGHDDNTIDEQLGPAMSGAVGDSTDPPQHTDASAGGVANAELSELPNNEQLVETTEAATNEATEDATPKMSKNQMKKLRRREKWAQGREMRKDKRKEKVVEKRERRRLMIEEAREKGGQQAVKELRKTWETTRAKHKRSTLLPLSIVIDCSYDDLMNDKERISLASQLTRTYSSNNGALWRSHVMFSSFNKLLKERFDNVLPQHKNWKGITLMPEDFAHAAEFAKRQMTSAKGGTLAGPFSEMSEAKPEDGEVIYLSSDSPDTLTELKPYSTYIVGGLVDKNRHKAICYKHAVEKGIKTAKLPIGEYIQMASRSVLTTNHVVEIMLEWLELRDWGEAFMKVLPPRKGGKLLEHENATGETIEQEEKDEEDERGNEAELAAMLEDDDDEDSEQDATNES